MKTKEQIALEETNGIFDEYELGHTGLASAMDKYAKHEAIVFAKWLSSNCYDYVSAESEYNWKISEDEYLISLDGMMKITREKAYELYLKSKTNV